MSFVQMGSIHDAASTSSSLSPQTSRETGLSGAGRVSQRSRRHQSTAVAALTRRVEGTRSSGNARRHGSEQSVVVERRDRSSDGTGTAEDRKTRRRSTSAGPAAMSRTASGRRSIASISPSVASNHTDRQISRKPRQQVSQDDVCRAMDRNCRIESILKKDRARASATSTSLQSLNKCGETRHHRGADASGDDVLRRTNGCGGSPRRVLFKNNVSIYRFDADPVPQSSNILVSSRKLPIENRQISNGHSSNVRPPKSPAYCYHSHDVLVHKSPRCLTTAAGDRRANGQSTPGLTNGYTANDKQSDSSSSVIVGNFEVYVDHERGDHHLVMSVSLPSSCRRHPIDADRILVKASKSGTRLSVVSEQSHVPHKVQESDEQFNEQFTLPVTVDPYRISARLERDGVLVIEAPVEIQ